MTFKIFSFDLGDSGEDAALLHSWLHAAIRNSILSQSFDREFQHVKCVMAKEELQCGWMVNPMLCSSSR